MVSFMFLPNNIARIDLKWLAESAPLKIGRRIQLGNIFDRVNSAKHFKYNSKKGEGRQEKVHSCCLDGKMQMINTKIQI